MTEPRRADGSDPRAWIAYAEADLSIADLVLRTMSPCPYWMAAYHAQQCAEKALKAYLIWRHTAYPHTHDLRLLLDECDEAGGGDWTAKHREVEKIGPMGVLARYPSLIRTVTKEESEWAIGAAGRLLNTVKLETGLH